MSQLANVADYPSRDMTITVEAGMPWEKLQSVLTAERQQLPLDVADRRTPVGAVVASDHAGSRQYGYGTMRDYLIGMECVDGHGRVFHAGGRVVKNVAGYDLCRLMVGSEGRFGLLTRLTFRLRPLPESSGGITLELPTARAEEVLELLNRSAALPVAVDAVCAERNKTSPDGSSLMRLTACVEGSASVIEDQLRTLTTEIGSISEQFAVAAARMQAEDVDAHYTRVANTLQSSGSIRFRVLPSEVCGMLSVLQQHGLLATALAGNGLIAVNPPDDAAEPQVEAALTEAERLLNRRALRGLRKGRAGLSAGESDMFDSIVSALDPHGVFA